MSEHQSSLAFVSLPMIISVIVVETDSPWFSIFRNDHLVCSLDSPDANQVVFPFVRIVVSDMRDVVPPGHFEGRFGGSHWEILEIMLSFNAVFTLVAFVTWFKILEAVFEGLE
jgi:hypothetical protein